MLDVHDSASLLNLLASIANETTVRRLATRIAHVHANTALRQLSSPSTCAALPCCSSTPHRTPLYFAPNCGALCVIVACES